MKKELFSRIFVGLLGGIVISYLITIGISLAIGDGSYYSCVPSLIERFGNEVTAIIIQSLLKQTSIYFGIVSVLMMTVAYICEWMEHSVKGVLSYFAIFVAIFVVVWIVQYLIWKIRIYKIKEGIQKNN